MTTPLWSLWNMLELKGRAFIQAISVLGTFEASAVQMLKHQKDEPVPEATKDILVVLVTDLLEAERVLGAKVSEALTEQFLRNLKGAILHGTIAEAYSHIDLTLRVELGLVKLLVLDDGEAALYEPKEPIFDPIVSTQFNAAIYDINEAAKCLAF